MKMVLMPYAAIVAPIKPGHLHCLHHYPFMCKISYKDMSKDSKICAIKRADRTGATLSDICYHATYYTVD